MQTNLPSDPLNWLLEADNPSVRYWAQADLLALPHDSPELLETRRLISALPLVQQLFSLQQPGGYWGKDESSPYRADGTLGVLGLLYTLGVAPCEQTRQGCHSLLEHGQHDCGGIALVKRQRSSIMPCSTGQHLPFLAYFGFGSDARVQKAFAFVIQSALEANSLHCRRTEHNPCLWGAVAALNGLAVLPVALQCAEAQQAIHNLSETLLNARYDFDNEHKRWLTFGTPRVWDLLSALLALARHGYAGDARFAVLFERFMACRTGQGRWLCGSVSRTWPIEKRGKPGKWVTLDALRLLKLVRRDYSNA